MTDGRWWWMSNLLWLLLMTAAVFTWLGWRLHVVLAARRLDPLADQECKLEAARAEAAEFESRLHEVEGALRRSEAELSEARLTLAKAQAYEAELTGLRASLRETEARLAKLSAPKPEPPPDEAAAEVRPRQEMLPLEVSLSLSAEALQRAEEERDALRAELDLLKRNLDQAAAFRSGDQAADDLTMIRGVGRVLEARLHAFGVFSYRQIADWTPDEVTLFGRLMGFGDRVRREDWQGQCRRILNGSAQTTSHARSGGADGPA